jgi:predicted Zn-dependent peptidase
MYAERARSARSAQRTTSAGTRILWVQADEPELAYVSIVFSVGFSALPPKQAHFAHFVEHIIAHLAPDERRRVDAAGVECNAYTTEYFTGFHASGLASGILEAYLPILASRLASPPSDALTHKNEASAVVSELHQHAAQPSVAHTIHVASAESPDSLDALDYATHIAFMSKLVKEPEPKLVASYVRAHFVPSRAHITVSCAALRRETLISAALDAVSTEGTLFHTPPRAPRLPRALPSALKTSLKGTQSTKSTKTKGAKGPKSAMSVAACAPDAKTHFSILVPIAVSVDEGLVASFCAQTLRDALFDELRTRLGLLYSVNVSYVSHSPTAREHERCRAELSVYAMCAGTHVAAAVVAAQNVISSWAVTDRDVRAWCDAHRASVLSARACRTPESLASWYELKGLGAYPMRSHDETLEYLRTFPVARAVSICRALRDAPLRIYVTTGDERPSVVRSRIERMSVRP